MIIITKAMKSKSKKQFQYGVRIGFSLQQRDWGNNFVAEAFKNIQWGKYVVPLNAFGLEVLVSFFFPFKIV